MVADTRLPNIPGALLGVRILRKDPRECLLSFICSSNTNIPRISRTTEGILHGMGFGYWTKYIIETRDHLVELGGDDYLLNLRMHAFLRRCMTN